MYYRNIQRFQQLPTSILVLHVLSRVVFGMSLGVLLAYYTHPFAWWIILAALILAIPFKYRCIKVYRTVSPKMIMLTGIATILFGIGLGTLFSTPLAGYGWTILACAILLGIPGTYLILKK